MNTSDLLGGFYPNKQECFLYEKFGFRVAYRLVYDYLSTLDVFGVVKIVGLLQNVSFAAVLFCLPWQFSVVSKG